MDSYFVSQIFALAAFILALSSFHFPRRSMLLLCAGGEVLNSCHFMILERPAAGMLSLLIAIRIFVFVFSKRWYLLYLFMGITLVVGIVSYKDSYSILPIVATLLGTYTTFQRDEWFLRKGRFACSSLWLLNNILIGTLVGACMETSSLISNFISMRHISRQKVKA